MSEDCPEKEYHQVRSQYLFKCPCCGLQFKPDSERVRIAIATPSGASNRFYEMLQQAQVTPIQEVAKRATRQLQPFELRPYQQKLVERLLKEE